MAELSHCPHCGLPIASGNGSGTDPAADQASLAFASQTIETMIPGTHSGDDGPDGVRPSNDGNGHGNGRAATAPSHPLLPDSDEFSAVLPEDTSEFDPLSSPVADPILDVFAEAEQVESGSTLPSSTIAEPRPEPSSTDEVGAPARSWPLVLLGSYASAMTLAVAWLLWHGHGRDSAGRDTMPVPLRAEAGRAAPAPLPAERRTILGQTIRVGSLEVTPLSLAAERVRMEWSRPGEEPGEEVGPECLTLRLRLKNVSADETFAPLDRGSVRPSESGEFDSFLEVNGVAIEPFPLAVASEKTIVEQSFAALKPGESVETIVVSEPDAKGRFATPGTWRLRLRVTTDQSATIGVDVRPDEVR